MKQSLLIVLILSFFTSAVMAEDDCCSIFEDTGFSSSQESDLNSRNLTDLHFSEKGTDSSTSHEDQCLLCICCFHSSYLQVSQNLVGVPTALASSLLADYSVFISIPFLDGPFQPPRA